MRVRFRRIDKQKLIREIDIAVAKLSKQSKLLKERIELFYKQAERLAREELEDVSKKYLAGVVRLKKMRSGVESRIADLIFYKTQVETTPPEELGPIAERTNEVLMEASRYWERTQREMGRLEALTSIEVEVPEEAPYGVSREELDEELRKMHERIVGKMEFPEVPRDFKSGEKAEKVKD